MGRGWGGSRDRGRAAGEVDFLGAGFAGHAADFETVVRGGVSGCLGDGVSFVGGYLVVPLTILWEG